MNAQVCLAAFGFQACFFKDKGPDDVISSFQAIS
jgi:hypothetical protein